VRGGGIRGVGALRLVLVVTLLAGSLACSGGGESSPTAPGDGGAGGGGTSNLAGNWAGILTHPDGGASDAQISLRVESAGGSSFQVTAVSVQGTAFVVVAHDPNQPFPCSAKGASVIDDLFPAAPIDPATGRFSIEFTHANAQDYSKPSRYILSGRFSGTQAEGELTAESFAGNTYLGDNENKGATVCPAGGGFGRSVWTASKR
jgi:hypothetical protein